MARVEVRCSCGRVWGTADDTPRPEPAITRCRGCQHKILLPGPRPPEGIERPIFEDDRSGSDDEILEDDPSASSNQKS